MAQAEIGLIGLGVMGSNLALNIAEKGHRIAVYNRTEERTERFMQDAGALRERIAPCSTLQELVAAVRPPRPVILMVPAGAPVDEQIALLQPLLAADDILIDAGNANFRDTRRRMELLKDSGPQFLGMGVSGGEEGARHGPSIMVGGSKEAYLRIEPVLTDIAARYRDVPCRAWLGPDGAGHFVKTIHNGIEYADMQMIAEIYGILRDGFHLDAEAIGDIFARWNGGRLDSYLIEITAAVLRTQDPASGRPLVDMILDRAGQKGTGRWAVIEAQMMGTPATSIEAAVAARSLSAMKTERMAAEKAYATLASQVPGTFSDDLVGRLEAALLAGKVVAYAQGFSVMATASEEFSWNLPLAEIARIWRAGCIIRSRLLDEIAAAFEEEPETTNLLMTPAFRQLMTETHTALRGIVARAAQEALPVPALSAALAYFDDFRRGRGTANLIQGQRDYFGAHGFERVDAEGAHHGLWKSD